MLAHLPKHLSPGLAACACLALLLPSARAQCFAWQSRYGPGTDGNAFCAAEFAGDLYVGGYFDRADGLPASCVARWNGTSWAPVDLGVSGAANPGYPFVLDMAVHDDGSGPALYVGGNFLNAGSAPASHAARWDGTAWSGLAPLDASVEALAVHDDGSGPALYAGGTFTQSASASLNHVARWNGGAWEPLDGGMDGPVTALFAFGGALFAGGSFTIAGTAPGTVGVARWSGVRWEAVGAGLPPAGTVSGGVQDFESFDAGGGAQLHAAGWFQDAAGLAYDLASWNGSQWTFLRQSSVSALGLKSFDDGAGSRLYIGSSSTVTSPLELLTSYDGTAFTPALLAAPPPAGFSSIVPELVEYDAGAGPELHAIGRFADVYQAAGLARANGVARWDGGEWHPLGSSPSDLEGGGTNDYQLFDDGAGTALFAGGEFTHAGTQALNHVARWDGVAWSALGAGTDDDVLALAVHADAAGQALYAGGSFMSAGGAPALRVARWNGSQWSALGAGLANKVRVMHSYDDGSGPALYAAGGKLPVTRWDGTAWTPVGVNAPFGWSMEVHDDGSGPALYVGDGSYLANSWGAVWRWDGQSWLSLGATDSRVTSLQSFDDGSGPALYAGGDFTTIGGAALSRIARWSAGGWSAVGTQTFLSRVRCMTVYDDGSGPRLAAFALGDVELWDGSSWAGLPKQSTYGAGVDLEAWGSELYVANDFQEGTTLWGPSFECPRTLYCDYPGLSSCTQFALQVSGTPSLSLDASFDLRAQARGRSQGLFFFGRSGQQLLPWGSKSVLCVRGPLQRMEVSATGGLPGACDGLLDVDFNAWMLSHPKRAPQAGDGVWLQGWFLDPTSPKGSGLTGAVEFYVWP